MAELVLGPMIRYVDNTTATIWVETDRPCTVTVLGNSQRTFGVNGHHYALVCVEGLVPGSETPYTVELDGATRWPMDDNLKSWIRTMPESGRLRILFGSCRAVAPHSPPYTLHRDEDVRGRGIDALWAYAKRMQGSPRQTWPQLVLLLGDQVYVDEGFPQTRSFIRSRRDTSAAPGDEVVDMEEYTHLYLEAWSDPVIRWLFANVSIAMIFDDHDVADDWNISRAWVEDMRDKPWWDGRITGGLGTYWIYQHLGNLSPADLQSDDVFENVYARDDAWPYLCDFARQVDRHPDAYRWSFARDLNSTRLVVVDSRCARILDGKHRKIVDEAEWRWLDGRLHGDFDHLLLGTSLPFLVPRGMHDFEAWSEAVCAGAWGSVGAAVGEKIRRAIDLEDWPAFSGSFERLARMLASSAAEDGRRSITVMSGDLHYSYLIGLDDPDLPVPVHQAVCSPIRNLIGRPVRATFRFGSSWPGEITGRALAASAGVPPPEWDWSIKGGPWFDNHIATIDAEGPTCSFRIERSGGSPSQPRLDVVDERRLV